MEAELYYEQPSNLTINLDSRNFLSNTARWGKFLAIVGFVFVGLMVLLGLAAMSMGSSIGVGLVSGALVSVFYLLFGLLYLLPVLYLYKFSSKMRIGLDSMDEGVIADSFRNLKSLFKFMGVLTIIMLGFYALAMLAVMSGAFIGAFM